MVESINNTVISDKEDFCLRFLSDKMEVNAMMMGRAIWDHGFRGAGSFLPCVGAEALGRLKRKGMVMRIPELSAWRLTKEGREYVTTR